MDITKKDYEKIIHFINSTYPSSSDISKNTQTFLSELFHLNRSLFWLADRQSNMYNLNFFNHKDQFIWDYTEVYSNQDIQHPKKQLNNIINSQRNVLRINETTTKYSFEKSQYYDFIQKHQIIDQMVMYFINDSCIYGGMGFVRFKGEKPFTEKDKKILKNLSIHLQQTIENTTLIKGIKAENLFLNEGIKNELGIIHVNKNQIISYYNDVAQKIINKIDPNTSVEDFLQTSIKKYLSNKQSPINLTFYDWKIKIITQKQEKQKSRNEDEYFIYLYPQQETKNDDHLKALLSKREAQIFDLVLKGFTNEQISKELWISINTVKKHLRNMYEKLGVSNRTGLIYKINGS